MSTFGEFIKQKRVKAHISQQAMAEALGYREHSTIWRKETGRLNWSFNDVMAMARLFGMRASELLAEWEEYEEFYTIL